MTEHDSATIKVLLVSNNVHTIDVFCHLLLPLAVHVEPCCDLDAALGKLCHTKYEGLIVDLEAKSAALELLRAFRGSTSHRNAIAFAILNEKGARAAAFEAGANFVFEPPLSAALVGRTLRASYPLIVREKRRYFRCPLEVPAYVSRDSGAEFLTHSVNISEGGIAVDSPVRLEVGDQIQLRLSLPGMSSIMQVSASVCWSDGKGRAGLEFQNLPRTVAEPLQFWLAERLQELMPNGSFGKLASASK